MFKFKKKKKADTSEVTKSEVAVRTAAEIKANQIKEFAQIAADYVKNNLTPNKKGKGNK